MASKTGLHGVAACLVALIFYPASGLGANPAPSFGQPKPVTLDEYRPHLGDDEAYQEYWNHNAWTREGHFIAVDFVIANLGLGDHKGTYKAKIKYPDGSSVRCKGELDSDEWSYDRTGFGLRFGKASVRGDLKGLDVTVRCKKLQMDLHFANPAPPVQPGGGRLTFGDEGYFKVLYPSVRARVTGTVRASGRTLELDAPGFVQHSAFNLAPHEFAQRWFRFKLVRDDATVFLTELKTPADFGRGRIGWALVYDNNGRLLASTRVKFQFDGYIKDSQNEPGYSIPRRVRLAAVDGDSQLTGQLLMTGMKNVQDPTRNWNSVWRALARRFSKPMQYDIGCKYDLQLVNHGGQRRFTGEAQYRFTFTNP